MKKKRVKKRMSNKKFRAIWSAVIAVIVILAVAANVGMNMFSAVLDSYLGRGKLTITYLEGSEDWDAQYYKTSTSSLEEAKAASDLVSEQVTDEGIVLLKNDGVLPLEKGSEITPFGYGYLNPSYSGTGAAATTDEDMVTIEEGLESCFTLNQAAVKKMEKGTAVYPDAAEDSPALDFDTSSIQAGGSEEAAKLYEYPTSIYSGIEESISGTTGVYFVRRTGSEGYDKRIYGYEDGTPHYLALSEAEKEAIRYIKETCGSVVVVLNTANPMELSPIMEGEFEADAIVWIGTCGSRGAASLGKILCGDVNPSGRLADIYATDFTADPTYANFGEYSYTNSEVTDYARIGNQGTVNRKFVEYEEGIYIGYRYYETAAIEDPDFIYGTLDGAGGISEKGAVTYPFGYGLSYTTFTQTITDFDDSGDQINLTVEVKNTGDVDGKDVVQVYYTSPYTEYDKENGVEKSVTELAAFEKTDLLAPGESETLTLTFAKEDMASYADRHENSDGTTGCYLLEAGEYIIELKYNSHDVIDSRSVMIDETVFYEGDTVRNTEIEAQSELDDEGNAIVTANKDYVAATNQLDSLNAYMNSDTVTNLSRADWNGTFPTAPENREGEAPEVALAEFEAFDNFDYQTDELLGNVEGSLVYTEEETASNVNNGMSLVDLRGASYNDERWDALLDQIDWEGDKEAIQTLLYLAAYQTAEIPSISKPATIDKDGAMGWSTSGASSWASANLMACTWNVDLMKQMGECIGEEALQSGLNGWYAPGFNTHRSPFAGRVYEYYSEDGLLAGKIGAAAVSGAAEKGVYSYIKHMVLNDQETYRALYLATWAREQAVREIYLKPFEICIKEAKNTINYISDDEGTISTKIMRSTTGVMSAQNSIGGTIGFAQEGILTEILRNEWGFAGAVVTDLFPTTDESLRDMSIRAGGDMFMNVSGGYDSCDYDSTTARSVMRRAIKNICYMVVNSNAVNNMAPGSTNSYAISPWKKALWGGTAAAGILVILIIAAMVKRKENV
jgi:beta-glucosidase